MRTLIAFIAALILSAGTTLAEDRRVIAIGSSVTEIVYALGQQDRLVGRDRTSTYPKAALELPDVGYRRTLSPEGVLSVEPDLILALEGSGPPDAIKVLQEAGVDYVTIADTFSRDGVVEKILTIGAALGVEAEARELAAQASKQMALAENNAQNRAGSDRLRVLFILNARDGDITVGGAGTQADSIIKMAGGINAAAAVEGFKPITPEALAVTAPDVILMMERQGNHAVSDEDLFSLPAIQLTPAGRSSSLIRMPGAYLLGFGPRTAEAIADLSAALQDVNGS